MFIFNSSIGKKFIQSISGAFLIIFLLLHGTINFFSVIDTFTGKFGAPDGLFQKGCDFMALPIVTIMVPVLALGFVVHIGYGCWLMTSTYAASNRTAHKIADQLEAAGQPLPASRYVFEKDRMRIFDLNDGEELDALPYGEVLRLGEDMGAYYLFRNEYGGYRVPKSGLGEREEEFRRFVQDKTGKLFIRRATPLNRLRQWLHARSREPEHL